MEPIPIHNIDSDVRNGELLERKCAEDRKTRENAITTEHCAGARGNKIENKSRITSRYTNPLFLLLRTEVNVCLVRSCVVILFVLTSVCAYKEQKFALEPQDQSAVVGSRVTLPCRVENKSGQLQWTKDDFGLGTHRHLTGYERYKMVGSDEEGDYSLDIREVTLEDDAKYQCQVSTGPRGEPAIRSRYAQLTVLVSPEAPKITEGSSIEVIEDREQVIECVSIGGRPPAEITWVDGEGGVFSQGVTYTVEPMSDGRRFIARSVLRLRPRRYHDKQTLSCQAQNTADRAYKASTIKIQVKYAPVVRLFLKSNIAAGRIYEGDKLRLGCEAEANPDDFLYKWYLNNQLIPGNLTNELLIMNVTRKYNDAAIKCEVHNSVGKSADSKTLEVSYGPRFITKPKNLESETGSTSILSCIVDGHPPPEITWLHNENGRFVRVGQSSNLSITVNQLSAGEYWCRASVEGFQTIEAHATVFIKGPPRIISNVTQYGVEGDTVNLECLAFAVPRPEYFVWTHNDREINTHSQEYGFLEEILPDGHFKSTLIIKESNSNNFGVYNCSVYNVYGSDSMNIHLLADKSLSPAIVLSVGSTLALLLLIIIFLIVLCHRKRFKSMPNDVKKPDVTDIGKVNCNEKCGSDRSSNLSELKLELRQVEGSEMDMANQSDTDYCITSNLGLPLAGPVPLSTAGFDNEMMKFHRYSTDFSDQTNNLHVKVSNQSNGYVPYVDYSRDYAPPSISENSANGSLTRSIEVNSKVPYSAGTHVSGNRLNSSQLSALAVTNVGPDVIPLSNAGVACSGVDVRYAATYGNPYLRTNGSNQVALSHHVNTANPAATPAPPPYYSVRNSAIPQICTVSPSSSGSSRHQPNSSSNLSSNGTHTQAKRSSPQSPSALYIMTPSSQSCQNNQITTKGTTAQTNGTHV